MITEKFMRDRCRSAWDWDVTRDPDPVPLWRQRATWVFAAIAALYLGSQVVLTHVGQGRAWGTINSYAAYNFSGLPTSLTLGEFLGTRRKGDVVHVTYDTTIRSGCLKIDLGRWADGPISTQPIVLTQSGLGETDLIVPADGWYSLSIYGRGRGWCSGPAPAQVPASGDRVYDIDFRVSWRL
jgi:hypothetical protein